MIDINFDHRTDSRGKDPDSASETLRQQHLKLWSKPLPSGRAFELTEETASYLAHRSDLGNFVFSSDAISNSIRNHKRRSYIISQIDPTELDEFQFIGATIGARIIFPSNRAEGLPTINVARGFNAKIRDRFDLTLECIRLHYLGLPNPLSGTLYRYTEFFDLFDNFSGYVDFFLLGDLARGDEVDFFLPFDSDFSKPALPTNVEEYRLYKSKTMQFVAARNQRIAQWALEQQINKPRT